MEGLVILGFIALVFYAVKNFMLGTAIKSMEAKDETLASEAKQKQAEIQDIKQVIEKVKQEEVNRPADQVEDFWNKGDSKK